MEPHTAALLEPYAGRHSHRGETFYPAKELAEALARLDAYLDARVDLTVVGGEVVHRAG